MIANAVLSEYANRLEAAGFAIYESVSGPGTYFRYSRMVDGKECFGYIQLDYARSGHTHLMPIKPSIEHGSSMWVPDARGKALSALDVETAKLVARPKNTNPAVGTHANYADPRFEYMYRRRGCSTPEQIDTL